MNNVIEISNVTKDYGQGRGVFDISFQVKKGELMGFLGPNGAGKTTTIRQLMGFMRPDSGSLSILGLDCFEQVDKIEKSLGYLPGEIAFIDSMTGMEFIRFVSNMKKMKGLGRASELMDMFELKPEGRIKKMSKGMKQKIAIICAFMQDPELLILDEPTSGLDPLMQNRFVELILKEKERGKTILMSSHIFEEVEKTCDRAAIIRSGRIAAVEDMEKLRSNKQKIIDLKFDSEVNAKAFAAGFKKSSIEGSTVTVKVGKDVDGFIKAASLYTVRDMNMRTQTLEELFMHFYGGQDHDESHLV